MQDFISYWGVLVSVLTTGSAAVVYFIKNWRDVEALKDQQWTQEKQIAALLEKVDDYYVTVMEREVEYRQASEL